MKSDEKDKVYDDVTNKILANTRCLGERTGIFSSEPWFQKGFDWIRLREYAMKDEASKDYAIVRTFLSYLLY